MQNRTTLGRAVNERQVTNLLGNHFTSDTFFPSETFFPSDTFFPSETFISNSDELRRMATGVGQRALRQANAGDDGIAIVLFVSPDKFDDKTKVSPGGAVFVTGSAGKKVDTNTQ